MAVSVPRADRNQIARAEGLGSLDRFLVRPRYTYGQNRDINLGSLAILHLDTPGSCLSGEPKRPGTL